MDKISLEKLITLQLQFNTMAASSESSTGIDFKDILYELLTAEIKELKQGSSKYKYADTLPQWEFQQNENINIDQAVESASKKYNVDKSLIYGVINAESSFNPNATSSCGAQGLMQLMPTTAQALGVQDPYNVIQNIDGGTKYLSELLSQFDNIKEKALAAYNAGPGTLQAKGEDISKMPTETKKYIRKVLDYMG